MKRIVRSVRQDTTSQITIIVNCVEMLVLFVKIQVNVHLVQGHFICKKDNVENANRDVTCVVVIIYVHHVHLQTMFFMKMNVLNVQGFPQDVMNVLLHSFVRVV